MNPRVQLVGRDEQAARALARSLTPGLHTGGFDIEVHAGLATANCWLDEVTTAPDAVVLDLYRPDPTGLALCRELRRVAPRVVLLALINPADAGAAVTILDAGADDCVPVSVHPVVMVARLRAHLRRGRPPSATSGPGDGPHRLTGR